MFDLLEYMLVRCDGTDAFTGPAHEMINWILPNGGQDIPRVLETSWEDREDVFSLHVFHGDREIFNLDPELSRLMIRSFVLAKYH